MSMYNGSYSFREFIIKFNGHINNLPNLKDVTHSAKHILQSFLTGHALNAYKSLPIDVRKGEWKNLLEELSLVIHGPEVQQEAKIILPSLRQDCDTVEIFAKKVENITFMAYPGKSNATTYKSTLKTIFMNGLNEDIRIHVLRDVPESFEAALKKAKLEESLRRIEKKEEETAKYDPMASTEEYTNVGTTRLGKPNLNTNFLFISFVILTMATYASAEKSWIPLKPHIFYDCEKPHGEVLIEVPPFGECSFEREPMRVRKETTVDLPMNGYGCIEFSAFSIQSGYVDFLSDGTVSSHLIDASRCRITDNYCYSKEAIVLWNKLPEGSVCNVQNLGSYSALIGDNVLLIEETKNAFLLDEKFASYELESCFGTKILSSNGVVFFEFKEESDEAEVIFTNIINEICEWRNKLINDWKFELSIRTTEAMQKFFQRKDISAVLKGRDQVLIAQCSIKTITHIDPFRDFEGDIHCHDRQRARTDTGDIVYITPEDMYVKHENEYRHCDRTHGFRWGNDTVKNSINFTWPTFEEINLALTTTDVFSNVSTFSTSLAILSKADIKALQYQQAEIDKERLRNEKYGNPFNVLPRFTREPRETATGFDRTATETIIHWQFVGKITFGFLVVLLVLLLIHWCTHSRKSINPTAVKNVQLVKNKVHLLPNNLHHRLLHHPESSSNLQSSSSSSLHRFADQVRILTKMSFSYVNTARKIEITLLVMCFFWTMTSAWHPVEPVDFYDCTNPTGHVLVELPPPANCSRKSEPKKLLTGKVTVHIRNESTDNIEAFKCTIRLQKKCVKNFLFFFNTPRFEFLRYLKPSSKECQKVRTEHTWSNLQLREVKKGIMISDPEERPLAVPFNGEACQTVKSFILHQGYVRGLNDGTMASDLIDTPNCNIKQRQCEAETAIVQWDTIPQRPLCDFITMGTFSAQIADGTLLIEEEQTAFPLDKTFNPPEHKNCFEKKAFSSNGYVYLTFKEDSQQDSDVRVAETKNEELATWTRMRRNTAVEENDNEKEDEDEWNRRDDEIAVNAEKKITDEKTARNYRLETLSVNGRLNYLSHKTEETLRKNFGATLLSICNMRNEKIREWKTMMGFSVTQSVRNFLNRKDIEAVGVGKDLVRVSQCVTETVTHIDLTKNYDEEPGKYEELQRVKTKSGRIAFVAAGNNYIIRNKQNHISCDEITPHYWKNLNGYWELDGAVVDVDFKSPPIETPTFQNMKLVFSTVDIFASGHVSTFPVAFAISAKADIRALEYQQRENAKKGSSYLSKIVASFPAVFNKVADAYVEFFNKVTSTYINWLPFGISTSGAVAVIIIAFVIWYQCRKAKVIAGINIIEVEDNESTSDSEREAERRGIRFFLTYVPGAQ
ncbi:hypothetical protein L5515_005659 [Caenorhabditis briggsae]|uniref:Uncharacterized protein n=1 Tax=Caenorhabditis briggsae TaxID=6238 RepID=A0AAE9EYI2_CAEBR|nr:hypothetical protein L5515_002872 [Caenorhabditis briggsae]UMM15514.1 hypothetical protein L5515_012936 [Caenorhabditis briggsae]UMM26141.1 hypothetical protein L5515_009970 [Caenorhabditis briggsae]UMM31474.1 hypothetical protein L5515_005659 [Caenorhabditis briggsae]